MRRDMQIMNIANTSCGKLWMLSDLFSSFLQGEQEHMVLQAGNVHELATKSRQEKILILR